MKHEPLVELGRFLQREGYAFVTVTPETHRRANANAVARGERCARTLREVLGWNRAIDEAYVDARVLALLRAADALEEREDGWYPKVRYSTLGGRLFIHGSYPTTDESAVFFGPDTYRFCSLIERFAPRARRVVDIGCGGGAGGIVASRTTDEVVLADVSEAALGMARINAELAGLERVEIVESDVLGAVHGEIDLVVANPPFLADPSARTYRDGGGQLGAELSLRIAREALRRLAPGGTLVLYTGSAIVDGVDGFHRDVAVALAEANAKYTYFEVDPDIFGEELESPAYDRIDRIAAVALIATLPSR